MITEDYISFEIAKLLKEKGFDEGCRARYGTAGSFSYEKYEIESGGCEIHNAILAPTIQMVMKWLRHVHGLHIAILWDCGAYIGKDSFCYHISDMNNYENKGWYKIGFESYEEACEAAIRYCLENLI